MWRSKRSALGPADGAEALRSLAALVHSGYPIRLALQRWYRDAPRSLSEPLRELAGRVRLGADVPGAIQRLDALGSDARALACVVGVHGHLGGDLSGMIERLAAAAEDRAAAISAGKASGAGALLSCRIVAGLPFLLIPFAPLARSPLIDPLGMFMLLAGGALTVIGMRWVVRLVPVPPAADPGGVVVADIIACVLDGGAPLHWAMSAVCKHAPGDAVDSLSRARAAVSLGATWPQALDRSEDSALRAISSEVRRALTLGIPIAEALRRWAGAQRADRRRDFEAAMRRAPVLMVVPLSVCVLPAYVLLGLGPYLRGLLV